MLEAALKQTAQLLEVESQVVWGWALPFLFFSFERGLGRRFGSKQILAKYSLSPLVLKKVSDLYQDEKKLGRAVRLFRVPRRGWRGIMECPYRLSYHLTRGVRALTIASDFFDENSFNEIDYGTYFPDPILRATVEELNTYPLGVKEVAPGFLLWVREWLEEAVKVVDAATLSPKVLPPYPLPNREGKANLLKVSFNSSPLGIERIERSTLRLPKNPYTPRPRLSGACFAYWGFGILLQR